MKPSGTTTAKMNYSTIEFDKKLDAIREIIVGNNFERINSRVKSLNQRVEHGNSHLSKLLEDLSSEVIALKKDWHKEVNDEKKTRFSEDQSLRNSIQELKEQLDSARTIEKTREPLTDLDDPFKNFKDEEKQEKKQELEKIHSEFAKLHENEENLRVKFEKEIKDLKTDLEDQKLNYEQKKQPEVYTSNGKDANYPSEVLESLESSIKNLEVKFHSTLQDLQKEMNQKADSKYLEKAVTQIKKDSESALSKIQGSLVEELNNSSQLIDKKLPELADGFSNAFDKLDQKLEKSLVLIEKQQTELEKKVLAFENSDSDEVEQEVFKAMDKMESQLAAALEDLAKAINKKLNSQAEALAQHKADNKAVSKDFRSYFEKNDHLKSSLAEQLEKQAEKTFAVESKLNAHLDYQAKAQTMLVKKLENTGEEMHSIKTLLEKEFLQYFEKLNKERKAKDETLQDLKRTLAQEIHDSQIKMEAKMEAFMSISQQQMVQKTQKEKVEEERKSALKNTLKQLSDLLND